MAPKKKTKQHPITVVHNFGGRRCTGEPPSVATWGTWDCDPAKTGAPSQRHAYGASFPWTFDMEEKFYVIEGSATLTPDDAEKHGAAVTVVARDCLLYTTPSPRD